MQTRLAVDRDKPDEQLFNQLSTNGNPACSQSHFVYLAPGHLFKTVNELGCEMYVYSDDSTKKYQLTDDLVRDQEKLDQIMKCLVDFKNCNRLKFNMTKTQSLQNLETIL